MGDDDGIVVVLREEAAEVLARTRKKAASEAEIFSQIEAGSMDRSLVEKVLEAKSCEIIG